MCAQNNTQTTRILFIFDASNSMNGFWKTKQKHMLSKEMLVSMVDSLSDLDNLQLALRVFGHQKPYPPQDCDDTKLEVPFADQNFEQLKKKIKNIRPSGTTPIAQTLEECADDFTPCEDCRNVIILITDGIEECQGDPCAISYMLQKNGITLKPFILGIDIDNRFKNTYDCVGNFYNVGSEEEFEKVLGIVVSQALNNTTVQVNLLDINKKPTETNVAMTLYNHFNQKPVYQYIHSMNARGVPDTIPIDAALTYDMVVHSIPSVRVDSLYLEPGKHNVFPADVPRGYLHFPLSSNSLLKNKQAQIIDPKTCQTLNIQAYGSTQKYLVGNYDVEINTLPVTRLSNVRISQSHTTDIEIPEPGVAHINTEAKGYGHVLKNEKGKYVNVYTWPLNSTKKSLYLQPGSYIFVFRTQKSTETVFTIEKKFKIKSGLSTSINLYE